VASLRVLFVCGKHTLLLRDLCRSSSVVECVEGETDAYTVFVGTLRKWPLALTKASGWPWSRIMSGAPRGCG
jgi:hypothetical protein